MKLAWRIAAPLLVVAGAFLLALRAQDLAWRALESAARGTGRAPAVASRLASAGGAATFFAVLGAAALAGARLLDRRPGFLRRLGLRPSPLGAAGDGLVALGTLFASYLGVLALRLFEAPSERLRAFEDVLADPTGGPGLTALLVLTLALGAAVSEELLFRGVLLQRLRAALPTPAAVAVVVLAFAGAHADLQHATAVLLSGLWLTLAALRSGSLRPAILGHLANNLLIASLVAWCGVRADHLPPWVHALAWLVAFPAFLLGLRHLLRGTEPSEERPGGA